MRKSLEKGKPITRTLTAGTTTGESMLFPQAAQIALVCRERTNKAPESVGLITSRAENELSAEQWLEKNIAHWGIETGLHARLDASRNDDRCRLRNTKPLRLHGIFTRIANSICLEWLSKKKKPQNYTTTDFIAYMSEEHDRRTIALITSKRPKVG